MAGRKTGAAAATGEHCGRPCGVPHDRLTRTQSYGATAATWGLTRDDDLHLK